VTAHASEGIRGHQPWRVARRKGYRRGMAKPREVEPERLPEVIKGWDGHWVALKDGEVVAAALNPHELVHKIHEMGPTAEGAVARYVPHRSDLIVIGVG
jgi:hypothetical protein